ncbi:MAG TPA: succinylglutamate desuccinylase/aspartoacylase family protein [Planctomycetota bacterium]
MRAAGPADELGALPRVLGVHPPGPARGGTLVLVVGGVHGNEPAGVRAIQAVLAELARRAPPFRGRLVGLVGNARALAQGRRYLTLDLNRQWTEERLRALRASSAPLGDPEALEQCALLEAFDEHLAQGFERVVLLDLHSTSAGGAPFSIVSDTLQNRPFAFALPVPVLLGLEERIEGTLLAWFADLGHVALCLEGGQNDLPSTVEHHVAALWLILAAAGCVAEADVPELAAHRARLATSAGHLPAVVELRYRYGIQPGTRFEMKPGYQNFQPVARGEELAWIDAGHGPRVVASPLGARLLMPRYQSLGDDGFFLGREVRPFWLRLSGLLRRAGMAGWVRFLPGVRRDPARSDQLVVDRRIARWLTVEILHLFGWRWRAREGRSVRFVRRRDAS